VSLRQPVPGSLVRRSIRRWWEKPVAQTHSIALRDADFHNGIAGVTIVEAAGSFGLA